jgi:hypothetical protein
MSLSTLLTRISLKSILLLSSDLRLDDHSGFSPSGFPTKTLYVLLSHHACSITCYLIVIDLMELCCYRYY